MQHGYDSLTALLCIPNIVQIPERWVPYRFDIFGASHQIFHVAVMVAAVIHFLGLTRAFEVVRLRRDICDQLLM
jgi:hypothetical protein